MAQLGCARLCKIYQIQFSLVHLGFFVVPFWDRTFPFTRALIHFILSQLLFAHCDSHIPSSCSFPITSAWPHTQPILTTDIRLIFDVSWPRLHFIRTAFPIFVRTSACCCCITSTIEPLHKPISHTMRAKICYNIINPVTIEYCLLFIGLPRRLIPIPDLTARSTPLNGQLVILLSQCVSPRLIWIQSKISNSSSRISSFLY